MAGIGIFVAWLGYSVAYFGLDQLRGGNNGLLSLMIPGKYSAQPSDSGGSSPGAPVGSSSAAPNVGNPGAPNPIGLTTRPAGAPAGIYGVDPNGTIYVKGKHGWQVYSLPGQSKPPPGPL